MPLRASLPLRLLAAASLALSVLAVVPGTSASAESEPARPPEGDVHDKVRRLWDAIVSDDPARATDVFFPREPFLTIKNMTDPGRYYDRLRARFEQDIHTLHAQTPDLERARFVRFELARRGGYVKVNEEGNRLPYWASRHSRLVYSVGKQERSIEVRVLIAWAERWYVIHLNEFH